NSVDSVFASCRSRTLRRTEVGELMVPRRLPLTVASGDRHGSIAGTSACRRALVIACLHSQQSPLDLWPRQSGLVHSFSRAMVWFAALSLFGCGGPPASRFPDGEAALSRMRATYACSRGLVGEAKIDFIDGSTRVRGNVSILASLPDRTRLDAFSPFGVSLSTLTTDGGNFAFFDLKRRSFLEGPATPCNISRFTQVPMPAFALVQLLRGEAPVLKHEANGSSLTWNSGWISGGSYRVQVLGQHESRQVVELTPHPDDFGRPWQEQRVRVLKVDLEQQGIPLYSVEFDEHRVAQTAKTREDPDGIDPAIHPSGPACSAEIPRRMRIVMPKDDRDLVIHFDRVEHNPPLVPGAFRQVRPDGATYSRAECGS
ncbi:MAG: hypothetical protein ACM3ZE_14525, partial [Myxococcales bacterium]